MDKLSSVLTAFRPTASSVSCQALVRSSSGVSSSLVLTAESSYWLYLVTGQVELKAQVGGDIHLAQGDGIWLAAGLTLEALVDGDLSEATLLVCEFDFGSRALNPLLDLAGQWVKVTAGDEIAASLAPLNQLLLSECLQPRCGSQVVVARLAEAYLVQMLRLFMQTQKIHVGLLAGLSDAKLARALVAMHESPDAPWQVSSLAEKAGMSRSAFSQLFKRTMAMTPMNYLTLWRMRLAGQRLKQGERNIALLSLQMGYQSEAAFRRSFKKVMGVAPGAMSR